MDHASSEEMGTRYMGSNYSAKPYAQATLCIALGAGTMARLQVLASRVYPESQCGFRGGRSTHDMMVFSIRQLLEKCHEQNEPLYLSFKDLMNMFHLVSRDGLFKILKKVGWFPKLLVITQSFHEDMQSMVCYNGATSEPFPISSGVKQGCMLVSTLFGIFFSMLLSYGCLLLQ